jgi:DNA-binding MarR family transcriptional regulator
MSPDLVKAILELSNRMLTLKAIEEDKTLEGALSERELIILNLLREKSRLSVSDIAEAVPKASYSTISTDITKLWRDRKMVSKTVDPDNQRVTLVELTNKGAEAAETIQTQRDKRFEQLYEALNTTPEEEQVMVRVFSRATTYFDNLLGLNGHEPD